MRISKTASLLIELQDTLLARGVSEDDVVRIAEYTLANSSCYTLEVEAWMEHMVKVAKAKKSDFLSGAFYWGATPEGHQYWANLSAKLISGQ